MRKSQAFLLRHSLRYSTARIGRTLAWVGLLLVLASPAARGQDPSPGQEDLDNATLAKISARSLADLESVSELCESALAKGLDEAEPEICPGSAQVDIVRTSRTTEPFDF